MYINPDDNAKRIFSVAFPNYKGRKFQLSIQETVNVKSSWQGGSRDSFVFVDLVECKALGAMPPQSQFDRPIAGADSVKLPENICVVRHTIFCGNDMGLTLIVSPANAPKSLDQGVELTRNEKIVLVATKSLKSSYAGVSNYRLYEANKVTGITPSQWQEAKATCTAKGLLDKRGAITVQGRNVVNGLSLYNLRS